MIDGRVTAGGFPLPRLRSMSQQPARESAGTKSQERYLTFYDMRLGVRCSIFPRILLISSSPLRFADCSKTPVGAISGYYPTL
jgi:hypothetical protein